MLALHVEEPKVDIHLNVEEPKLDLHLNVDEPKVDITSPILRHPSIVSSRFYAKVFSFATVIFYTIYCMSIVSCAPMYHGYLFLGFTMQCYFHVFYYIQERSVADEENWKEYIGQCHGYLFPLLYSCFFASLMWTILFILHEIPEMRMFTVISLWICASLDAGLCVYVQVLKQ